MITFPNCKINIGLDVLERREDGYHNIETLMLPIAGLTDSLEIVPSASETEFSSSGLDLNCPSEENLCMKALRLMQQRYGVGEVKIHLHKMIPSGAGLGGGSSDAVFTIKALDSLFGLELTAEQMYAVAAELGSDTVFFIGNHAALCSGRGEITEHFDIGQLCGKHITIVKPPFDIPTIEAYAGIVPQNPERPLCEHLKQHISTWRGNVKNDFEPLIFAKYSVLAAIKEALYDAGAIYASMSGSGSAIFSISEERLAERLKNRFADTRIAILFDDSWGIIRNENDITLRPAASLYQI